jgi:uncharacterized SAM-binding protein YcdF (DUF218 family)
MTEVVKFFIDPFNLLWISMILLVVLWWYEKNKLFRIAVISWCVIFLSVSTPTLPKLIINSLEDQYSPLDPNNLRVTETQYHIIILGGGHGYDDRLPANSLLSQEALGRLSEGLRLHLKLPNSKLVLSGYSASGRTTQAEILQEAAVLLGVAEKFTVLQKEPGNTFEEAKFYAERFGDIYPLIIVTSAVHMPRAMYLFNAHDLKPVAAPTNYRLKGNQKRLHIGFPSLENIDLMRVGLFEYAAITREKVRVRNL